MSYDFNTRLIPCSHVIVKERYVVDLTDFRTLHLAENPAINMRAPINGQAEVTLQVSGKFVGSNDPVYGYSILPDTNWLQTSDKFYKIMFNKPVRWFVPLIEVGYITLQAFCLRCNTQGQLNDFRGSSTGSFTRVTNTEKLVQRVLKLVLTSRCSFYPQFTCRIKDYIGKKFGVAVTETDISSQIMDSLQNLKNIQSAQRTVQALDPREMLKDITGISTSMPDPTSVNVECSVTSYGVKATPQTVNFSISSIRQLVGN